MVTLMNKLTKSFMLIRCSDPDHVDCTSIKDSVFDQPETTEAYTTNVDLNENGQPFCVAATIIASKEDLPKIKKRITAIKTSDLKVAEIKTF